MQEKESKRNKLSKWEYNNCDRLIYHEDEKHKLYHKRLTLCIIFSDIHCF